MSRRRGRPHGRPAYPSLFSIHGDVFEIPDRGGMSPCT